jgi:polysaccharide pyruvyl transferase WcaK-like protein
MNIALCGFYGKSNFGDNLLADNLSLILSGKDNENNVIVFSDNTNDGVINGLFTNKHLEQDIIVIGGGGIVNPKFWVFKEDRLDKLIESKKPILFLNVNVTNDFLFDEIFVEKIKLLSAQWWVRDHNSIELLKRSGIEASFLPDICAYKKIFPIINKTQNTDKQLLVFLNSYLFNKLFSNNTDEFLKSHNNMRIISSYLEWMATFDWNITFLSSQVSLEIDDRIPSGFVFSLIKNKKNIIWNINKLSWNQILEYIINSDLVLSTRYHSTLLSIVNNIPVVDITHHAKNGNFINELSISGISVLYEELTKDKLIESTQYAEKQEYQPLIDDYIKESNILWDVFIEDWRIICNKIDNKEDLNV